MDFRFILEVPQFHLLTPFKKKKKEMEPQESLHYIGRGAVWSWG